MKECSPPTLYAKSCSSFIPLFLVVHMSSNFYCYQGGEWIGVCKYANWLGFNNKINYWTLKKSHQIRIQLLLVEDKAPLTIGEICDTDYFRGKIHDPGQKGEWSDNLLELQDPKVLRFCCESEIQAKIFPKVVDPLAHSPLLSSLGVLFVLYHLSFHSLIRVHVSKGTRFFMLRS